MNDEKIPPNFQQTTERNVKIDLDLATRMKSYLGIELLSGVHGHFGPQLSAPYAEPLWSAFVVVGQFWKHIVGRLFCYVYTTVAAGNWLIEVEPSNRCWKSYLKSGQHNLQVVYLPSCKRWI